MAAFSNSRVAAIKYGATSGYASQVMYSNSCRGCFVNSKLLTLFRTLEFVDSIHVIVFTSLF